MTFTAEWVLAPMAAIPAIKQPPPEQPESIRERSFVVLSFWAVVILLGIPVWLWTTSIHRANLPLQEMLDWGEGKACKLTFPLRISIDAPLLQETEAQHLVRTTQHALDDLNEFSAHHLRLSLGHYAGKEMEGEAEKQSEKPSLSIQLHPKDNAAMPVAELRSHSTILDVFYASNQASSGSSSSSVLASSIAAKLQEIFSEEQSSIAYILASNAGSGYSPHSSTSSAQTTNPSASGSNRDQRASSNGILSPDIAAKLARRRTRALKYASTYHISISLFTPTAVPTSWDIEAAVQEYLTPLLRSFSISNFTVDTQVQLYATFPPSMQQPSYDPSVNQWTLRPEGLSGFINAAEWPLGPSIGSGPTLNFLLYVPSASQSPLVISSAGGTAKSWLIPQWGGVTILNPSIKGEAPPPHLTKEILHGPMLTFSHQLLSLLGAPDTPSSFPLQLQTLTRIQAASLFFSASSTLASLAQLSKSLASIPIPENVALGVQKSLTHLRSTCDCLRDGRSLAALEAARVAEEEAEKAFFEKSMVGQVYFPDQHKIAVYLPMLGPIGVPLITSLVKVVKEWWKNRGR